MHTKRERWSITLNIVENKEGEQKKNKGKKGTIKQSKPKLTK